MKERYRRRGRPAPPHQMEQTPVLPESVQPENHQFYEPDVTFSEKGTFPVACPVPMREETNLEKSTSDISKRSFLSRLFDLSPRHLRKSDLEN